MHLSITLPLGPAAGSGSASAPAVRPARPRELAAQAPRISVRNLRKEFGEGANTLVALDDFSLDVADGEFVCVLGPSGCGKSTALRIMADLEKHTSGELVVHAKQHGEAPVSAMVFQDHSLFPWLTVLENVTYGLEMRGVGKQRRVEAAEPFLKMVGLAKYRDYYPHQLSGGMKQRASLARAFVVNPDILLMDEPFAALDAQNKVILQEELLRIWEADRKTIVFITHDIEEALALSDRIVIMTATPGRIKEILPVTFPRPRSVVELRANPQFGELYLAIWRILENEVRLARAASE
jgi:NitT/TauT family transport system ATP-binding protein